MKINSNFLNFTVVLIFLASCSHNGDSNSKISKINIVPSIVSKWNLEDEMDDFYFIPLATQKDFLIKSIDKIYFTDDEIIIIDIQMNSILVFNRHGYIKYKIAHQGRGPGEYSRMNDALFDEKKMQFEVFDRGGKKILYYSSLTGNFLFDKKIDNLKLTGLKFYKNKSLYVFDRHQLRNDGMRISVYNEEKMSYIKSFLPIPEQIYNFNFIYPHVFENYHDSIYYLPMMDDKIYTVTSDFISPVYELNYPGKTKIDYTGSERLNDRGSYDNFMSSHEHLYGISNLFINDRYISFQYEYKHNKLPIQLFYSKKTGKIKQCEELRSLNNSNLRILSRIIAKDGAYYVMELNNTLNKFLPINISKNLNESSNPVLLFFKLKDF